MKFLGINQDVVFILPCSWRLCDNIFPNFSLLLL